MQNTAIKITHKYYTNYIQYVLINIVINLKNYVNNAHQDIELHIHNYICMHCCETCVRSHFVASAVLFACILLAKFKKSYFNALTSLFIKF